jgi:hypothetical protein
MAEADQAPVDMTSSLSMATVIILNQSIHVYTN